MKPQDLRNPGTLQTVLQQTGVMGVPVDPPSPGALRQLEQETIAALRSQGEADPAGLIASVTKTIAAQGDADGLYENTDRMRALQVIGAALKTAKHGQGVEPDGYEDLYGEGR